jgi:hypothetical protein
MALRFKYHNKNEALGDLLKTTDLIDLSAVLP